MPRRKAIGIPTMVIARRTHRTKAPQDPGKSNQGFYEGTLP